MPRLLVCPRCGSLMRVVILKGYGRVAMCTRCGYIIRLDSETKGWMQSVEPKTF